MPNRATAPEIDREMERAVALIMPTLLKEPERLPDRLARFIGVTLMMVNARSTTGAYLTWTMALHKATGIISQHPDMFEERMMALCKELSAVVDWHLDRSVGDIVAELSPKARAEIEQDHAELMARLRKHGTLGPKGAAS